MGLFCILPEKAGNFVLKLLFGITLGMYVQGNYLNISYGSGVLDGTKIHWEYYTKYGLATTAVWIVCIAFPFVVSWFLNRKNGTKDGSAAKSQNAANGGGDQTWKILAAVSVFIILMQIPAFIFQAINYHPADSTRMVINKNGEFTLGGDENVLVFVLDTLDEKYYADFLEENPEYTETLTGFVHYGNTLASGARTPVAVPSMFTGVPFRQDVLYSDYKSDVWGKKNSLSVLHDTGYDVGFYSETILFSPECCDYITNFMTGTLPIGSWPSLIKNLYKMDLYKFMPHYLKRFFLIDTADFDEAINSDGNYVISDSTFLRDYRETGFGVDEEMNKTARIYHLRGAHPAYHLDRSGEFLKESTRKDTVYALFAGIQEMLDQLREMGLYDSSTIIITADHGDVNLAEQPIFLLKEKNATDPYRDSTAPFSLFDLPVYLTELAGEEADPGEFGMDLHALAEDEVRERHFFRHDGGSIVSVIKEWKFTGNVYDPDQMVLANRYENENETGDYVLGTELSFGLEQTGNPFIVDGFGKNTGIRTVLHGPHSILEIPIEDLPEKGKLHVFMTVTVKENFYDHDLIILANNQQVYQEVTSKKMAKGGIEFDVPIESFKGGKDLLLEFYFPHLDEDEMDLPVKERTDTIRLKTLTITA